MIDKGEAVVSGRGGGVWGGSGGEEIEGHYCTYKSRNKG